MSVNVFPPKGAAEQPTGTNGLVFSGLVSLGSINYSVSLPVATYIVSVNAGAGFNREPSLQVIANNSNINAAVTPGVQSVLNITSTESSLEVQQFINWTSRSFNIATTLWAVAYGANQFVAGGNNGVLSTSPDGISWTSRSAQFGTTTILGIAFGNGVFCAWGQGSTVRTSTDGVIWTSRTGVAGANYDRGGFGNGIFVVGTGTSGELNTSTDGITWTSRNSNGLNNAVLGYAYGAGLHIVVSQLGVYRTSTDGVTWTSRPNIGNGQNINDIVFANGIFAAVCAAGQIHTSTNGTTWTSRDSKMTVNINRISYIGNQYVAIANTTPPSATYSTDGTTWRRGGSFEGSAAGNVQAIAVGDNKILAVGNAGVVHTGTIAPLVLSLYRSASTGVLN